MLRKLIAAFGALILVLSAGHAMAQPICGDRGELVSCLEKGYGEFPTALGLDSNGSVVELFTSAKDTWSLLVTRPDGFSCLVAAGDAWETWPLPVKEETV